MSVFKEFQTWIKSELESMAAAGALPAGLDLSPVVRRHVQSVGKEACFLSFRPTERQVAELALTPSDWIVAARDLDAHARLLEASDPWPARSPEPFLWTDDYSNLFRVLRRK